MQTQVVISGGRKFTEFDPRTIRSIFPLECGNLLGYKDKSWLIISEVAADRSGVYRGLMRLCNFMISVQTGTEKILKGYDGMGRPVYEYIPIYTDFNCVLDGAGFQIDSNQTINLSRDEIRITMQDNESSSTLTKNLNLNVMFATYTIQAIDRSRVGVITFVAKLKI